MGMFSQSYNTRYPPSGKGIVLATERGARPEQSTAHGQPLARPILAHMTTVAHKVIDPKAILSSRPSLAHKSMAPISTYRIITQKLAQMLSPVIAIALGLRYRGMLLQVIPKILRLHRSPDRMAVEDPRNSDIVIPYVTNAKIGKQPLTNSSSVIGPTGVGKSSVMDPYHHHVA